MSQAAWGWSWVTLGALLVGVGGALTTLGWNRIRSHDQWRNSVVGVVREVTLNSQMIEAATQLAGRWPARSAGENFPYESFHDSHVLAMVTSGALSPRAPADRELLQALDRYHRAVERFNAALRIVGRSNPGIYIKTDLIHVTDMTLWPKNTRDALAEPFVSLLAAHEAATSCLERHYSWATRPTSP